MNKELIKKYLMGDCTYEEEQNVKAFLGTQEGSKVLDDLADEFWQINPDKNSVNLDERKLYEKIIARTAHKRKTLKPFLGYAASFILLALASYFYINHPFTKPAIEHVVLAEKITKTTTRGQKSTIMLSDGSKVILNAESSITYFKYFTDTSRNIELSGEAFFDVAKDKNRPFNVKTESATTTALGTSFNINNRSGNQKISLASGSVKISSPVISETFVLIPGEALSINSSTNQISKGIFDVNKDLSWKDGVLFFQDTRVAEIIGTLERWYDVKIQVSSNAILSKRYTGTFKNSSLEHVLESMSFALDLSYKMDGKNISIKKAN